jgi:hypothetical protein
MAARVGETTISVEQVDRTIEHAREEAKREGKPFPAEGTLPLQALRRQALDLLIYREELAQRAIALGLTFSADELEQAVGARTSVGNSESGEEDEPFVKEGLRSEILYRKIYRRVTRKLSVSEAEVRLSYLEHREQYRRAGLTLAAARMVIQDKLLETKRNALMARWIARMKQDYAARVRYGADFQG